MNKGKPAKIWLKNPKQNGQKRGKKRKLRKMPRKTHTTEPLQKRRQILIG